MNETDLKFYQQESEQECTVCNKSFHSKMPERYLQFCSEQCEGIYMKDIIQKAFKDAEGRVQAHEKTERQTTY